MRVVRSFAEYNIHFIDQLTGPSHCLRGIMQANWSHQQVEGLINGGILFTQPHARKLQTGLAARSGQVMAASK
jgi:hypothetical protein